MFLISTTILIILTIFAILELTARGFQLRTMLNSISGQQFTLKFLKEVIVCPKDYFISVHIPTYNEPPELVIATMQALGRSTIEDYEVIIIDNNTDDPELWRPVKSAADRMGGRFKFIHIDRLQGAKAGGLNIGLSASDPRTTHVAIVDADYQVSPEFLSDGLAALANSEADYVQFPQAYRGVGQLARGVERELGDYFFCFSGDAGRPGSMLPTGTLSMFTASALRAVGGWPTETITEDAEIGVRLQAAGFRGLWLAREQGTGLLPVDFRGLAEQRARWAAGNFQVLRGLWRRHWSTFRFGDIVNLVVQLTAWATLWLPAAAALTVFGVLPQLPLARAITGTSAFTILGSAMFTAARLTISSNGATVPWSVRFCAMATKFSLTWVSAAAWLPALASRPLRFQRTPKSIGRTGGGDRILAAVSLAFLGLGVLYAVRSQSLEAAACCLLASAWVCAQGVNTRLRRAAQLNPELR